MQAQQVNERRRVHRVALETPVPAAISGVRVHLLELSVSGARVEHDVPMAVRREVKLAFEREGDRISLTCEVVRCRLQRSAVRTGAVAYNSGLRFTGGAEPSREQVRAIVAELLARSAETLEATACSGGAV